MKGDAAPVMWIMQFYLTEVRVITDDDGTDRKIMLRKLGWEWIVSSLRPVNWVASQVGRLRDFENSGTIQYTICMCDPVVN